MDVGHDSSDAVVILNQAAPTGFFEHVQDLFPVAESIEESGQGSQVHTEGGPEQKMGSDTGQFVHNSGRASGWKCDIRKIHPYGVYDKVDFKEIVYTEGDCFARYLVRMDEIMESLNIIEQLIDNIPEGPYQEKMKPIIRVPEGSYYAAVEGSRGDCRLNCYWRNNRLCRSGY